MNKEEKKQEVEFLSNCFQNAKIAVLTDYRGLTVEDINSLRKQLKKAGCDAHVVKNTLTKLALAKVYKDNTSEDLNKLVALLESTNMLLVSYKDPVEPTKVVTKFAKDKDKFKVKGAFFEGAFLAKAQVEELSKMPSREEILGKLLCLINTPATQLLRVMKAPAEQVVRLLDAVRQKKES